MGSLALEGDPPFHLGPALDVEAKSLSGTVEVTVLVCAPEIGRTSVPIQVVLELEAAQKLRSQLDPAIMLAQVWSRQHR